MLSNGTHSYIKDNRNENIKIYINGDFYNRKDAKISVFDSGFLLGDGVWEGVRLLNGNLVFIEEHLARLYYGANKLAIDIGKTQKELTTLIYSTLNQNNMKTDVHIRLIISRGLKITPYQHPNANIGGSSIVIIPEYKKPNVNINNDGIKLVTVNVQRGTQNSQDPRLNTLSKLNCITACIEADMAGADEGIMLDINGNVATCNSTNFFIIKNGEVWTSTGEYCLPGITRKIVISICKKNNIPIFEKNFVIEDVYSSDEVFVTGTFAGIIPVIMVDKLEISNGKLGKLTKEIQQLYKRKLNKLYNIN
tara:strand:+ start:52 stop:972 length:921 start_codon:yes stop_codon:yes gene_type:complete